MPLLLLWHPRVSAVADVVQYATPQTVILTSSPTISPSVLTGSGNVAETGGGADALADMNAAVNATTGVITFGVGGATPAGDYSFEFDRNGGTPFTLVVHVVLDSGGTGGAFQRSAFAQSALQRSPFSRSAFG